MSYILPCKQLQAQLQPHLICGNGAMSVNTACCLCGQPAFLRHILNTCSPALLQGCFTWRHDSVLPILKKHLLAVWNWPLARRVVLKRKKLSSRSFIEFVPAEKLRITRTKLQQRHHDNKEPLHESQVVSSSTLMIGNFSLT